MISGSIMTTIKLAMLPTTTPTTTARTFFSLDFMVHLASLDFDWRAPTRDAPTMSGESIGAESAFAVRSSDPRYKCTTRTSSLQMRIIVSHGNPNHMGGMG